MNGSAPKIENAAQPDGANELAGPLGFSRSFGFSRDSSGQACLGGRPLSSIVSQAGVTTPAYVYDLGGMRDRVERLKSAFGSARHLIAYAMKANSSGRVLSTFRDAGVGIDAVSGGELLLARRLDIPAQMTVFSGVAKTDAELDLALQAQIFSIQAESPAEVTRILARAESLGEKARVSLRINPAVEIDSHAHISTGHVRAKFGIPPTEVSGLTELLTQSAHGKLVGLSTHVGSMLRTPSGYIESARVVCEQARALRARGVGLEFLDFGGGFGIDYGAAPAEEPAQFAKAAVELLASEGLEDHLLVVEPGRSLVGPFGVLVASVVQTKQSGDLTWLFIDAGMNDLMRPALYGAIHRVEALDRPPGGHEYQVAGPVCESTDNFGAHALGTPPTHVVLRDAGAYGYAMASEYNARPLASEVFVDGGEVVHVSPSRGVEAWIQDRLR
jgi:diaminopimelate decarboxylase